MRYDADMSERRKALEELDAATAEYEATEETHDRARDRVVAAIVAALRAEVEPTVVADRSPFTAAYIRRLAREAGVPAARPGPKPPRDE